MYINIYIYIYIYVYIYIYIYIYMYNSKWHWIIIDKACREKQHGRKRTTKRITKLSKREPNYRQVFNIWDFNI